MRFGLWGCQSMTEVFDCVFLYLGMLLLHWQYLGIIFMLWNETPTNQTLACACLWYCMLDQNMTALFCVHNSIYFDNILNITAWNVAPNHERASIMYTLLYFSPKLLWTYVWGVETNISNLDSLLYKTCYYWFSVQLLCNLGHLSLFSFFPFLNNGLWWQFS